MKSYDISRTEHYHYFEDDWKEVMNTGTSLGYNVRERHLGQFLEFKKDAIRLEVSNNKLGFHEIHIKSPFLWNEVFHVRTYNSAFGEKTRSRVIELLYLLLSEAFFEKQHIKDSIQSKFATFNNLSLEQLKDMDKETLDNLEQAFDFLDSLVAKSPANQ